MLFDNLKTSLLKKRFSRYRCVSNYFIYFYRLFQFVADYRCNTSTLVIFMHI